MGSGPRTITSQQIQRAWRYSGIKIWPEDVVNSEQLGTFESFKTKAYQLNLPSSVTSASLNADGTLVAVASGKDVHLYDTSTSRCKYVFKGAEDGEKNVIFHPTIPSLLVSAVEGRDGIIPTIMVRQLPSMQSMAAERLKWQVPEKLQNSSSSQSTERFATSHIIRQPPLHKKIDGRLRTSFQSEVWSHDGSKLLYMARDSPESNSNVPWDFSVWDVEQGKDIFTCSGHTDNIMWLGYSPDDTLIASVSWDQSFRIWIASSGLCLHVFKTKQQNWTGGFSHDSMFFAGTSGDGHLWIYDIVAGTLAATYNYGEDRRMRPWARALAWQPDTIAGNYTLALGTSGGRCIVLKFDGDTLRLYRDFEFCVSENIGDLATYMTRFLETREVTFVSESHLAWWSGVDEGIQLYDLRTDRLWRFPTGSSEDTTSTDRTVRIRQGVFLTIDGDVLRLWKLPFGTKAPIASFGWTEKPGFWRQPSPQAAREILLDL